MKRLLFSVFLLVFTAYTKRAHAEGYVVYPVSSLEDRAYTGLVTADGGFLPGGMYQNNSGNQHHAVLKYTSTGTLDTSWNGTGIATTYINSSTGNDYARTMAWQGTQVVTGGEADTFNGTYYQSTFALTRWNANGTLDNSFGKKGKVTTSFGSNQSTVKKVLVDGASLIAVGYDIYNGQRIALAKYLENGSLDTSFNGTGKVLNTSPLRVESAVLQGTQILIVGTINTTAATSELALVRYNADGTADNNFGANGIAHLGVTNTHGTGVALQDDGKIVVSGFIGNSGSRDLLVARFSSDGILDTATFNPTYGFQVVDAGGNEEGHAVAIQPNDQKILVAGFSESKNAQGQTVGQFAAARLWPNGAVDSASYGLQGVALSQIRATSYGEYAELDGNNNLLVFGHSKATLNGHDDFTVVRFNSNGVMQ